MSKEKTKKDKVESKGDIRFYCVVCGTDISVRDTLTHEYIAMIETSKPSLGEGRVPREELQLIADLLSMDYIDYYHFVLSSGVSKDELKRLVSENKDRLKDSKNNESVEWVHKAWHDQTIQLIEKYKLGEMTPIGVNKVLEAILSYRKPLREEKPVVIKADKPKERPKLKRVKK